REKIPQGRCIIGQSPERMKNMHSGRFTLIICLGIFLARGVGFAGPKPIVLGYYTFWGDLEPSQIRYANFTHLAQAFLRADPDGNAKIENPERARQLCKLAHQYGVKVLLSLGGSGSGESFSAMMKDPEVVERYVGQVLEIVKEYGYDGLDVDWE